MADHLRRQLREIVGTKLTGLTTTGSRVFQSRVYPLETTDLPGLLISTVSESAEMLSISAPGTLERRLTVQVEAVAKATADLDDTLDGICKEVEVALAAPFAALEAKARSIALTSTEIEIDASGAQPIGKAVMNYEIVYFAAENAPDTAL